MKRVIMVVALLAVGCGVALDDEDLERAAPAAEITDDEWDAMTSGERVSRLRRNVVVRLTLLEDSQIPDAHQFQLAETELSLLRTELYARDGGRSEYASLEGRIDTIRGLLPRCPPSGDCGAP